MYRGAHLVLTLALGLALVGCSHAHRPPPISVTTPVATAGGVTLTADLEGYAPDLPGWVFVLVPWDYVPAGSDGGPLDLELASSDGGLSWWVDPTVMALLPTNAGFFASGTSDTEGVVLVYQAPYDSLEGACLRGRFWDVESGRPYYKVSSGLTPLPPMPTSTGAATIPRTPAGETVKLGDCAVRVDKVVFSDRVGGYSIKDSRFLAVTSTVTPLNKGARCVNPVDVGLVPDPATIDPPNHLATVLAQPNQGGIGSTAPDGSVTATVVFRVRNADQPYLVFTDSTSHVRFDLGLADADSVADIAPEQPLIPLGQTASSSVFIVIVRGATVIGGHIIVELDLTNPGWDRRVQYYVYLLDGDGHLVFPSNDSGTLHDKMLGENESVTGTLSFDTPAPDGARLLLWDGVGYQAPDQLSLWAS